MILLYLEYDLLAHHILYIVLLINNPLRINSPCSLHQFHSLFFSILKKQTRESIKTVS